SSRLFINPDSLHAAVYERRAQRTWVHVIGVSRRHLLPELNPASQFISNGHWKNFMATSSKLLSDLKLSHNGSCRVKVAEQVQTEIGFRVLLHMAYRNRPAKAACQQNHKVGFG